MYFDTHVHFQQVGGDLGIEALLARAVAAGVGRIVAVGGSDRLNRGAREAGRRRPEQVRIALGYDRDQTRMLEAGARDVVDRLRNEIAAETATTAAVGETGLDYHYSAKTALAQVQLFERQLALARELGLPVIVHSREAEEDTLRCLRAHAAQWSGDPERLGVLHCFTGGAEFADRLLDLGYHISFSGIVTFRNADSLRAVAGRVPPNRLLIETDTPYLAPVPMRGKKNEPAYLRYVAEEIARVREAAVDEVSALTSANAERLFG
jgi:TatD DNase family protein